MYLTLCRVHFHHCDPKSVIIWTPSWSLLPVTAASRPSHLGVSPLYISPAGAFISHTVLFQPHAECHLLLLSVCPPPGGSPPRQSLPLLCPLYLLKLLIPAAPKSASAHIESSTVTQPPVQTLVPERAGHMAALQPVEPGSPSALQPQ